MPNLNRVFPNRTTTEDASSLSPPLLFVPSRSIRSSPRASEKTENKKMSPPPPLFPPRRDGAIRSLPVQWCAFLTTRLVAYLFLFRYASYRTHFYYHFPCSIPVQPFFALVFLSGDFPPCLQRRVILLSSPLLASASSSSSSLPSSLSLSLLSLFFLVLSSRLWDLDLLGHPGGPVHAEAPGAAVALDRGIVPAAVGVEGVDLSKGGDLVAQGRGDCAADGILLKLHVAEGGQDGELGGDCAAQAVVD